VVRQVIRREFKISLSVVSVGRLLRTMGLSPQRPLYRAYQQNPEAVQRWKAEQFPAIRKQAKVEGAMIYFADEAGVRSDYHAGTTWAPVGRTPVVKATGARFSLNMLSAVFAQGAPRFMIHEGTVNATVFIDFCKRLLRDADGPVYLVVDGPPAHRAGPPPSSSPAPRAGSSCSCCPPTRPSSTPTSGCGRTSNTAAPERPTGGQKRRSQSHCDLCAATATETPRPRPGLLRRPVLALHHRITGITSRIDLLTNPLVGITRDPQDSRMLGGKTIKGHADAAGRT
jgi:hypothetical protein